MPPRTREPGSLRAGTSGGGRAFTILEILIAMTLAVTLAALVGTAIFSRLREATFDETIRQTRSAFALIREDARREGEPLRLIARENDDKRTELVALPFDAPVEDPFAIEEDEFAIGEIDTGRIAFQEDRDARTTMDDRAQGRVYLTLPRGYTLERLTPEQREAAVRLLDSPQRDEQDAPGEIPELEGFGPGGFEPVDGPVTIGLFLPDGSVIGGSPPILTTPSGAMIEISINPWTGRVSLDPVRPEDPYAFDEDDLSPVADEFPGDDDRSFERDSRGNRPGGGP